MREIETSLLENGFSDGEVVVVHPSNLDDYVDPRMRLWDFRHGSTRERLANAQYQRSWQGRVSSPQWKDEKTISSSNIERIDSGRHSACRRNRRILLSIVGQLQYLLLATTVFAALTGAAIRSLVTVKASSSFVSSLHRVQHPDRPSHVIDLRLMNPSHIS